MADPIVFAGAVEWSGENPGISLKEASDGPLRRPRQLLSRRAVAARPRPCAGPHCSRPTRRSPRAERANYCLHDNEPLARYLVSDFVSHFGAYKGLASIGSLSIGGSTASSRQATRPAPTLNASRLATLMLAHLEGLGRAVLLCLPA